MHTLLRRADSVGKRGSALMLGSAFSLFGVVLVHVYLYMQGLRPNQLVTFWLPLEFASFIVLLAVFYADQTFTFVMVIGLALTLHLILPLGLVPDYVYGNDAIYGYQVVARAIQTGNWQFGAGTGIARNYSAFPLLFVLTALWSEAGSIPLPLIANYAVAVVNITSFLCLRMLGTDLLSLTKRQTNLILFLFSLTPAIHRVESRFHYEAYASVFFSLVLLYALKPKISRSETIVALMSILAIAFSHYFTSYILMLNAIVILLAYFFLRGSRINRGLLFLSVLAPLAWNAAGAGLDFFARQVVQMQDVAQHVKNLGNLFGKLLSGPQAVETFYPAPWLTQLASVRNLLLVVFSLVAIFSLCLVRRGKFGIRIARRDAITYLAATWVFSLLFAVGAYYGVVWSETVLATEGPGSASNRIAEFSFLQFAIFAGIGLSIFMQKLSTQIHGIKLHGTKIVIVALLIVIFVSSGVVQAYPRSLYDSTYVPVHYDEYYPTFQEPVFMGNWWSVAGNNSARNSPFTGSRSLKPFVRGFGYETWWEDNMSSPYVDMNDSLSASFTVHYAMDLKQLQMPENLYNVTLSPSLVSSQDPHLNTVFNTGGLEIVVKPAK